MEFLKNLKNVTKDDREFYENFIKVSLLLNALAIITSSIYELDATFSFYGQIVGIIFLITFFSNLGLVILNDKYFSRIGRNKRKLHFLTYGYLIVAVITASTLISLGLGDIKRQTYDPFYYILFCYGFYISYFDYKQLITNEDITTRKSVQMEQNAKLLQFFLILFSLLIPFFTGFYIFNIISSETQLGTIFIGLYLFSSIILPTIILLLPIIILLLLKCEWKKATISSTTIEFLKIILIALSLLTFLFAGFFAFNILSGGVPLNALLYLINFILPVFFASFILILPVVTIILYKTFPRKWKKISKSLTIIGIFLTITLSLPFISAPISIIDANCQFANAFGKNWNKFDSEVEEEFLDMPHILIQSWFGEPDLDPDSWKLDSNNVYKETDDYKLKYDIYYPGKIAAQHIGKKATIIFIHGGGWSAREREDGAPYLRYFAAHGYVCFTIDYRLLEREGSPDKSFVGDYNIENMMRDIANFTQYLAVNEDEDQIHGADLDNVFLIGQSAGAHLAGVTGFGYNDDEWGLDQRLKIKGIVLFYPPNDARSFFYGNALYDAGISKYKTPDEDPDFYDLYTPSKLVDDDDPPCLIFQGTSDTYVPYVSAEEIKKACEKEDVKVILITSYFIGHAHDISVLIKTMALYYMERFFYLIKED